MFDKIICTGEKGKTCAESANLGSDGAGMARSCPCWSRIALVSGCGLRIRGPMADTGSMSLFHG